ncbi:phenolic glucoside malonyltransferase 1-like [Rhododendron vialii]|uniref:phenolic glucoside malonyltransferase 1-like n=1 Tax=Rhododendron vialii TaxID=182163 RepID=UPI00265EDACA|nr:phenolic glucoside malonyltransferase 1-like [Rhododendron vialii]
MAQSDPVKVLDVCRVAPMPHTPNSTAQTSLPLTFFDLLWLRFPPTQRLFFYKLSYPETTRIDTILPKVKHSLSVTLQHYIPLAGNLTWPLDSGKPIVQYNEGDAVSLTVAESEANFYQLSGNSFREAKELHHFLPYLLASQTRVPAMALQITLFPNAGFCIGYAAHHTVFDGKSIAMFMHSWASICKHDGESTLIRELNPIYDRTIVKDPSDLQKAYLNGWPEDNGANERSLEFWDIEAPPDAMLGTFQLTKANIESIKKWVEAKWQEKHTEKQAFHPSTFAITSAYTWVCLIKTRKLTTEKVHLGFMVDCRARLEPPIPSTYFGNCVTGCFIDADTNKCMEEDGVAIAAWAIGEAVGGLDDGVLKGAKELIPNYLSRLKEGGLVTIAGSPRFELYKTDFGWGRPSKVEMVSIDKSGAFYLSDSRDGNGGIEIGVVLKKHETEAFASLFASGLEYHQVREN